MSHFVFRNLAGLSVLFFLISPARAQITDVNNGTSTPIQGAGHDYLRMLNETVNPANGSVSLRIQVPVPPGRQLTLPFSFAYDSNSVYTPQGDGNGNVSLLATSDYLRDSGWSYSVPMLSNMILTTANPTCSLSTGYVFQDSSGGRYSFRRLVGFDKIPRQCVGDVDKTYDSASTDFYSASLAESQYGACGQAVAVSDLKGNTYYFPAPGCVQQDSPVITVATSVEDRNGNIVSIAAPSGQSATYTDTLGRAVLSISGFGATGNTVTVSGLSQPYTLTWGTAPANFVPGSTKISGASGCANSFWATTGAGAIKAITLPNGKQYQLSYDPTYGLLSKITYPSGGYISYSWTLNTRSDFAAVQGPYNAPQSCDYTYDTPALAHRYVSYDGVTIAEQQDFSYQPTTWNPNNNTIWTSKQTTVTTKDCTQASSCSSAPSFQTIYTYTPVNHPSGSPFLPNNFATQIPVEQKIVYNGTSGSTLRTVNKTWFDEFEIATEQTVLDTQSSQVNFTWNGGAISEKDDYDFGQSSPTRKTIYTPNNLFPSQVIIQDSNSNRVAETDYVYATTTAGVSNLPTGTHDETNYGPSSTNFRGNPTTITRKCLQSCTDSTTTFTYDETGQVLTMLDACGNTTCSDMTGTNHTTSYSYADSYTTLSGGVNVSYTPTSNTNAFLTKITDALGHTQNFTFDFNNGQLTIAKDPNALSTTYIYNDSLARPTQANTPDGGQTTISYNDSPYNQATPSPSVASTKKINSTTNLVSLTAMDGIGHIVQTQLTSDPSGTDITNTTYDGLSRVRTKSNPHRSASSPTDGTTTFYYDAIGRTCLVVPPDGTLPTGNVCPATSPANDILTTYSGNTTTIKDQAGVTRETVFDGLGRLTQVFEDPGSSPHLNYETDYTYDLLSDLLTVNQKGGSTSSSLWRTRTFVYDSLSQLTSSTNPESNTQPVSPFTVVPTTYVYDANGNLSTKTAPAPNQTGTTTVVTTYSYDVLNRLTQKSFSDSTPTVKYGYDAIAPPGCTPPTLTIGNGIGKRTGMCDAAGAEAWSYDIISGVGWKLTDARTTNAVTKSTIVQNNLVGSAATLTYPSGRVITYAFDAAARPISAIDSIGPINYATAALFAPTGALSSLTNGSSPTLVSTLYFNNRLQPCRISVKNTGTAPATCADAATGNVLDFAYNFSVGTADNGNVTAITNNRDTTRSQSFVYDSLNRISTAKTNSTSGATCWDEAFGYDPWGNLLTIGRISGYTCSNEELLNSSATPQNQVSGDTYDTAGNIIAIPSIATYTFNAENRLTATAGVTYVYDGDGKRVQKASGGTATKLYWYGMGSDALDETDGSGSTSNSSFFEYIFFGGQRIARRDSSNNVTYYFSDHLGTARIVANSSGTAVDDSDFYPFGGERVIASSSGNHYKFTGKERDSESSLDNFGARYDSSSMGRFMSPDPMGGQQEDPQSLNRYAYVRNNSLNLTDPTGLNFNLTCKQTRDNASTCQGGLQGTTTTTMDSNGHETKEFTPTEISNKDGNLVDQNGNKYSGTFDGNNVSFTKDGTSQSSTGVWKQGTDDTTGIHGTGNFDHFDFTFKNHNSVQTLYAEFEFHGTQEEAGAALKNAGFVHWSLGFHFGDIEYRQNVEGRNSFHFNLANVTQDPKTGVPITHGDMHNNEYYAGTHMWDHFWHDVVKQ
jgi:RHS repeat-associated protein